MADQFSYLSVHTGLATTGQAGGFAHVQFLNTDWISGGTGGGGSMSLVPGSNVSITQVGTIATIAAAAGQAMSLVAGANISVTQTGATATVAAAVQTFSSEWWRGVTVSSTPPATGIMYVQWLAGSPGYWGWVPIV